MRDTMSPVRQSRLTMVDDSTVPLWYGYNQQSRRLLYGKSSKAGPCLCWDIWTRPFGRLNNGIISTVHALYGARATGRELCINGNGQIPFDKMFDLEELRKVHPFINVYAAAQYRIKCVGARAISKLSHLIKLGAHNASPISILPQNIFSARDPSVIFMREACEYKPFC